MSLKQQRDFFVMISDLIRNGFSIRQSVEFYDAMMTCPQASKIVIERLSLGKSFANALAGMIDDNVYYQVLIAEQHGKLNETLCELKKLMELRFQQRNRIKELLSYPLFLLLLLIAIMVVSRLLIWPQLQQLGSVANHSSSFSYVLLFSGLGCLLIGAILFLWFRQLSFLQQVHLVLKIPLIGNIYRYYYAYLIVSNLALMLNSGLDTKAILAVSRRFNRRSILYQLGTIVQRQLEAGVGITGIIKNEPLLPNEIVMMILKGDVPSQLAKNLTAFADVNFKKMDQSGRRIISWIQPTIFIFIGIGILLTYLAMLMPMYNSLQGG